MRLVDLIIPATHNSNTYTFSHRLNFIATNQIWNIQTQLEMGIRSLDLRYGIKMGNFIDKHGIINGTNFEEQLF